MGPFHFPSFNLLVFALGKSETLKVILDSQSDSVEFDLCDNPAILRRGPWMI
jgi:hypothetical protein